MSWLVIGFITFAVWSVLTMTSNERRRLIEKSPETPNAAPTAPAIPQAAVQAPAAH